MGAGYRQVGAGNLLRKFRKEKDEVRQATCFSFNGNDRNFYVPQHLFGGSARNDDFILAASFFCEGRLPGFFFTAIATAGILRLKNSPAFHFAATVVGIHLHARYREQVDDQKRKQEKPFQDPSKINNKGKKGC